jgi:copper chaperone CopZ
MKSKITILIMALFLAVNVQAAKVKSVIKTSIVCNTCKNMIESALKKQKGINSVKADITTAKVKVVYDDAAISLSTIEDIIVKLGYDANDKKKDEEGFNKLPKCCKSKEGNH